MKPTMYVEKTQRFDITQKGIRIDGRDMSPHAAEVWV